MALSAMLEASLPNSGRVIFLTPRQSQHRAVVETVKMLPVLIRTVDLLSRDSMCPLSPNTPCLDGRRCHLQAGGRIMQCARELLQRPLHAQELMSLCLRRGACPYLSARVALNAADLVIGDHTRVFGDLPDVLRFQGASRPQYLIVDEAHHLPASIMGAFSKELCAPHQDGELETVWSEMLSRGHRIVPQGELRSLLDRHGLPEMEDLVERWPSVREWTRFGDACIRVALPSEGRISLRFLEPSLVVEGVLRHCVSALFMSGTLHPPELFAACLGLEDCRCRSYPSPFDPARRMVLVVPEVGTRFRERCPERTVDMATRIGELSEIVPGNVLVFFPSYTYLSAVYRELRRTTWRKHILAERPGLDKREKDLLVDRLKDDREVLMLCNIRGSFAEGVNFPAGRLSAVMVAGLPLPPPSLERKELRSRALKRLGEERGGPCLDIYQTLVLVLQACGRLIRREEDRGAVMLLDPRYREEKVARLLPPDMYIAEGDPERLLREFFEPAPQERWPTVVEGERIITGH